MTTQTKIMRAVNKFLNERDDDEMEEDIIHWYGRQYKSMKNNDHDLKADHHKEQAVKHRDIANRFAKTGNTEAEEMHNDAAYSHERAAEMHDEANHKINSVDVRRSDQNSLDIGIEKSKKAMTAGKEADEYGSQIMNKYKSNKN